MIVQDLVMQKPRGGIMNKRIEINRHSPAKRRLFAVDIENIVGCGKVTEAESREVAIP